MMDRFRSVMFLLFALICTDASGKELRWKFKTGDQYVAKLEQKSEVASSIGGRAPSTMTLVTGLEMTWKVTAVDDQGAASITQRFERFRVKLEMPKCGATSYDSASRAKPTGDARNIAAVVQPLVHAKVRLTLNARGEITSVDLDEACLKAIEGLDSNSALKAVLSKEGMSNILHQMVVVLPEGDAQPGDEWPRNSALPSPFGNLKQTTTFKLLEPEEKSPQLVRIESVSILELDEAPSAQPRPIALASQHQKGLMLFDNAAGRLRSAEVEQELVTTCSLKDTPLQAKLVSSLKMTLEEK